MGVGQEQPGLLDEEYADRQFMLQSKRWKTLLDVQRPYKWIIRRLKPGRMLDIGCGIGRCLAGQADAVGGVPNPGCFRIARARGFAAYTPDEFNEPLES